MKNLHKFNKVNEPKKLILLKIQFYRHHCFVNLYNDNDVYSEDNKTNEIRKNQSKMLAYLIVSCLCQCQYIIWGIVNMIS